MLELFLFLCSFFHFLNMVFFFLGLNVSLARSQENHISQPLLFGIAISWFTFQITVPLIVLFSWFLTLFISLFFLFVGGGGLNAVLPSQQLLVSPTHHVSCPTLLKCDFTNSLVFIFCFFFYCFYVILVGQILCHRPCIRKCSFHHFFNDLLFFCSCFNHMKK